ncbi:hypothetical protein [Cecembia rubra]|nr:hypothetical protein [Cecembia rubra]
MKSNILLLTMLWIANISLSKAQEADTLKVSDEKAVYDFVILNSRYQNAFTFLARDFGLNIPMVSTDVMYYFNSGLYLNASGIKFFQSGLPWQYALTAGYAKDISNKTDFNLSYSQFLVVDESSVTGIQNLAFLQGTFGWEWGPLYSSIQGQLLFNREVDYFISLHNSRYFEFDQKLFKLFTVSFEPKFSLMAGSSRFYVMGQYEFSPKELEDLGKLQLQSWEFFLPLTFNVGYFDFEFQGRYVKPLNVPDFDLSAGRFVVGGQLSYTIPVKRTKKL